MINIQKTARTVAKSIGDNSPTLLTIFAVGGVIATAGLAVRATPEAVRRIDKDIETGGKHTKYGPMADEKIVDGEGLEIWTEPYMTPVDKFKTVWMLYIPAASMGLATIICIVGSNTISNKRNVAMVGAYTLADATLKEYREKVKETFGEGKEQKIRDDIAQDQVTRDVNSGKEIIYVGDGETTFHDATSGRYFKSDMESVRKAVNDLNAKLIYNDSATVNDFYELIGLRGNDIGESLGWRNDKLLELAYSAVIGEDNKPCISISFSSAPIRNPWKNY